MAKKDSKKNIDYEEIIHHRKLPLLTLDNRWHQVFENGDKPQYIKKLEEELNDNLKKQGKITNEFKELQKLKKKLMKEIVQNMDEVSDGRKEIIRQKKLDKSRKLIEDINEKLENCEQEQDDMPREIRQTNESLMIATAENCYDRIKQNENDLLELNAWIDKTRIELKKRILIKQEKEEINEKMYTYLHDMLGPKFMEAFDIRHKN